MPLSRFILFNTFTLLSSPTVSKLWNLSDVLNLNPYLIMWRKITKKMKYGPQGINWFAGNEVKIWPYGIVNTDTCTIAIKTSNKFNKLWLVDNVHSSQNPKIINNV